MKLSAAQIAQAKDQIGAQPVPENHPIVPQLIQLYGSHTFFLDGEGLEIVEAGAAAEGEGGTATVVRLAQWSDNNRTALAPHEPVLTDTVVALDADEPEPNT